jgi:hypothetical protein
VGLSCRIRRVCTGCPRCRSGAPRAGMATGHRVPSQLIGAAPPLCDYPPCRGHKGCSLPTARRTRPIGPNDNGSWVLTSSWALGSVPRRERHLRSKDLPAWPVLTLNPGSSVRVYPRGPTHTLRAWLFGGKWVVPYRPGGARQPRQPRRPRTPRRSLGVMTDESMRLGDAEGEWYYCFKHKKVETRDECQQMDRMGPYLTQENAENWRERVVARNEKWENEEHEA